MNPSARDFLFELLGTPSPSGYEWPVQRLVRSYLEAVAESVSTDAQAHSRTARFATTRTVTPCSSQVEMISRMTDWDPPSRSRATKTSSIGCRSTIACSLSTTRRGASSG